MLRFWGAVAKLRKAAVSFVMCVCPSVHMEQRFSKWTDFREIWKFEYFSKNLSRKFKFVKNWQEYLVAYVKTYVPMYLGTFMKICRSVLRMRNVSERRCRENQNTHFMSNYFFPPRKSFSLLDNVEKYYIVIRGRTDHGWQYNTAHAYCMLD